MKILAIDPGTYLAGFVLYSTHLDEVLEYGKIKNEEIINKFAKDKSLVVLIEQPDYLVRRAGGEVIETIIWTGRFMQAFIANIPVLYGRNFLKKKFKVKKDAEVIQFIKTRYPGLKLRADAWQAFLLIHNHLYG
jgi:hypothetical protein